MNRLIVLLLIATLLALLLQPPALLADFPLSPISPPPRPLPPPARPRPPEQREAKRASGVVIVLTFEAAEDTAPVLVGQGVGE